MKNTFGNNISMTVFGESHGRAVGAVIDGLAPGLEVDTGRISERLAARAPQENETARRENDRFEILSGVFNGRSTGTPLTIVVYNDDVRSADYSFGPARPSHADYVGWCKYHGYEDYRGGGHFSGRVTAAIAAAGGLFIPALEKLGVRLASHILTCGHAGDRTFDSVSEDIESLRNSSFPVLDKSAEEKMKKEIAGAKAKGDSIGGTIQTAVAGLPAGLGEPWFDSMEGVLSHALFSIGGIKGVEFGEGFACAQMAGSKFNDPLRIENGKIVSQSNHNGGVNGGITNGMPLLFTCAVRPTASIAIEQNSVDFLRGENITISTGGRHDPCIVRRVCPVIDSMTAFVLCDMLSGRYGSDVFTRGIGGCSAD